MTTPPEERDPAGRFPVLTYEMLESVMDFEVGMGEVGLDFAELRDRNPVLFRFFGDASMESQGPMLAGLLMYRGLRTSIQDAGREMPTVDEPMLRARIPSGDAEALYEQLRNENPNAAGLVDIAASHGATDMERVMIFRTAVMTYFLIKDAWESQGA